MEKSLVKDFSKYVSLNILGMIGVSFYILADTYYIAKALGATGIAALNFAIPVFSIILGIGLMIGIGGAARFGILKSRNKHKEAEAVFAGALKLGTLVGLLFAVLGLFGSKALSSILGADAVTLPLTHAYMATIMVFAPFFILNNTVLAFVRNDNNPRLAMLAMIGGLIAPIFKPLGFGDWRVSTALITGFTAKESVVSTLTVLLGGNTAALSTMFTPASAFVFLTFTLLYTPCVAAMAAVKRELGSTRAAAGVALMQCVIAWIVAFIVHLIFMMAGIG